MILMTFRYYSIRLHALLCLSVFALLSLPALADTDENAELYANMNTRLSYMQQVALYKWQHQLPIRRPRARENSLSTKCHGSRVARDNLSSDNRFLSSPDRISQKNSKTVPPAMA